ncbi:MAG: hypothetical protein NC822_02560 [Candidatus Omnitrophica bacterium]|nr:hypothetical protein [Candidatus Omnitrophota bacterium]MCM8826110.1 hypothetical protein [Candidatus Omnitrophota bacterium]
MKKIALIFELILSSFIAIFFFLRILNFIFPSFKKPLIKDNYIYIEGKINVRNDQFVNLISFNYDTFVSKFPQWNNKKFSRFMQENSLIITDYKIDDFNRAVLELNLPYWNKDSIEIFFRKGKDWLKIEEIILFNIGSYALEDIVFLGLGMDSLDFGNISQDDFICSYFKDKKFRINKSLVGRNKLRLKIGFKK